MNNHKPISNKFLKRSFFWNLLLISALTIGIFFRFYFIGKWPFTDDEFYMAQSIENILTYGLPKFECGGYYTRGLIYQYLSAGGLLFFPYPELLLRSISALANVFSIPVVFFLGKRIGGKSVAYMATIFFAISVWEIEFARFARMYALFQFIFLIYLSVLYKIILDKNFYYEKYLYVLTILAAFTYEGAVFLSILNFLPILYFRRLNRPVSNILPIIVFCFVFVYISINFRRLGVIEFVPENFDLSDFKNSIILLPDLLLSALNQASLSIVFFLPLSIFYAWSVFTIFRLSNIDLFQKVFYIAILTTALLHQYGLLLAITVVGSCFGFLNFDRKISIKPIFQVALFIGTTILFWTCIFFFKAALTGSDFESIEVFAKNFIELFIGYPDFFHTVLYQWYKVIPNLLFVALFLGSIIFIKSLIKRNHDDNAHLLLIAILTILLILIAMLNTRYLTTRYTFFIYPLVLLVIAKSINEIPKFFKINSKINEYIIILMFLAFTLISEDINFSHLLNIDKAKINFRTIYSKEVSKHYYNRYDYKTGADYINSNRKDKEPVLTMFTPTGYYLKHLDYVYIDAEANSRKFFGQSACFGNNELWTNANIVYTENDLLSIIEGTRYPIWIIAGNSDSDISKSLQSISKYFFQMYSRYVVSRSIDNRILVYKISPKKN